MLGNKLMLISNWLLPLFFHLFGFPPLFKLACGAGWVERKSFIWRSGNTHFRPSHLALLFSPTLLPSSPHSRAEMPGMAEHAAGGCGGREGGRGGYLLRIGSREIFTVVFPLAAQPLPAAMFFLVRGLITSGDALGDLPMGPHFQSFRWRIISIILRYG